MIEYPPAIHNSQIAHLQFLVPTATKDKSNLVEVAELYGPGTTDKGRVGGDMPFIILSGLRP